MSVVMMISRHWRW